MAKASKEVVVESPEGASTHQLVSDFFRTDIMNHCEFLKQLNEFGGEDCYLIAEICNRLVEQTKGVKAQAVTPFYGVAGDKVDPSEVGHIARDDFQKHKSFPRNCFNIMMVYAALTGLDGHEYNVYELAYLNSDSSFVFYIAQLIFAIQSILLYVVVSDNALHYDIAFNQKDASVILIDACTTIFIVCFCYAQFTGAQTFTKAVKGVVGSYLVKDEDLVIQIIGANRGKWRPELCLMMNQIVNEYAISLAPVINFYFILLSSNAMDALLNGFSLLFIFELDDYILPLFAGIGTLIVTNKKLNTVSIVTQQKQNSHFSLSSLAQTSKTSLSLMHTILLWYHPSMKILAVNKLVRMSYRMLSSMFPSKLIAKLSISIVELVPLNTTRRHMFLMDPKQRNSLPWLTNPFYVFDSLKIFTIRWIFAEKEPQLLRKSTILLYCSI